MLLRKGALAFLFLLACSSREELPPFAEALIVVDTDLPVPALGSRLRFDAYREDGTWIDSRDVGLRDPQLWPASFSLYAPDDKNSTTVLVRLRAYVDGAIRDYRNKDPKQRFIKNGVDRTPRFEPLPNLAIDRLARIPLRAGQRNRFDVVLRGACIGTEADLANKRTCIEHERESLDVAEIERASEFSVPKLSTLVGSFGQVMAAVGQARSRTNNKDGLPLYDEEVRIDGGAFVLGRRNASIVDEFAQDAATAPERIAIIPSLFVDKYEVTVGRWRNAIVAGFQPPKSPRAHNGPMPRSEDEIVNGPWDLCTFSNEPLAGEANRENYPLTCVPPESARAFCQFYGSDLLTEAQWEYVASFAGRAAKATYPWGEATPTCDGVIFGRIAVGGVALECARDGFSFGPLPVTSGTFDVTPNAVFGMGGGVSELALDSLSGYDSPCWMNQPQFNPRCLDESIAEHVARGGSFGNEAVATYVRSLFIQDEAISGFRCGRVAK